MELDLKSLTLMELREVAKANNIKSVAKYRKQELLDLLEEVLLHEDQVQEAEQQAEPHQDIDEIQKEVPRNELQGDVPVDKKPEKDDEEKIENKLEKEDKELKAANDLTEATKLGHVVEQNGRVLKEKISGPKVNRNELGDSTEDERNSNDRLRSNGEETDSEGRVFPPGTMDASGILEIMDQNSFGFLRGNNYLTTSDDIYVSPIQIRRFRLKTGDELTGKTRPTRDGEKFRALFYVDRVNGDSPGVAINRREFDTLTPIYPNERLKLEVLHSNDMSTRIMDIISPVGKGQRGLIVAPPKAGKTTILKKIAQNIHTNNPEVTLIVLLIDERPEEVTDMRESIDGEVIYSTFDEDPMNHIKVAEMVLERAKRLVEHKKDVVILLDSLTRLSRAYNLTVTPSGRTLSGGLDPAALTMPKKFFGAARNIRNGGSLTILATALVDTGSRMDDMIFEEFKGTGNMEVHLDRRLQERRIFPAIDIFKSGTRKEELIMESNEIEAVRKIRQLLYKGSEVNRVTEELISLMDNSEDNEEFIDALKRIEI